MWAYVCSTCIDLLTPKEREGGHFNEGIYIDGAKAKAIGERVQGILESGEAAKYLLEVPTNSGHELARVIICEMERVVGPTGTEVGFSENHLRGLADFCLTCEGFSIC
jgi:hypothetical protein